MDHPGGLSESSLAHLPLAHLPLASPWLPPGFLITPDLACLGVWSSSSPLPCPPSRSPSWPLSWCSLLVPPPGSTSWPTWLSPLSPLDSHLASPPGSHPATRLAPPPRLPPSGSPLAPPPLAPPWLSLWLSPLYPTSLGSLPGSKGKRHQCSHQCIHQCMRS